MTDFIIILAVAVALGSILILVDAWCDRSQERKREQAREKKRRRLDLFNRTIYALWENPTRPCGWYGRLDQSLWRR